MLQVVMIYLGMTRHVRVISQQA